MPAVIENPSIVISYTDWKVLSSPISVEVTLQQVPVQVTTQIKLP